MTTIIGLFDSVGEAEKAARDLMSTGFSHEDIGLIASDATGEWSRYEISTLEAAPSSKALGTKMVLAQPRVVWGDWSLADWSLVSSRSRG